MRLVVFCAFSACLAGNLPAPDNALLSRIHAHVMQDLARLPDYTCTQTIERATRRNRTDGFHPSDLVRLEVAYVGQKELFGYPGSDQLNEAEVRELVPEGVIGNGDFAMLARDVFANPSVRFTLTTGARYRGRAAVRCDYQVPLATSTYHLRVPPRDAIVGYHGTFWVDAATLDLLRFEVDADAIPDVLGLESSHLATDYQQTTFGDAVFALPQSSELLVSGAGGWETMNHTRFTACRQFHSEASVVFDDGAEAAAQSAAPKRTRVLSLKLPRDFSASLTLETPIDSATAAVGDPVRFRLERDLRQRSMIVVPRGAMFMGRIVRLHHSELGCSVAFRLESVSFADCRADLRARRNTFSLKNEVRAESGPSVLLGFRSEEREPGSLITVLTDHLHWPKGFQFSLRSRLP